VDQPSTKVLPGAGGGGGERPARSQAAIQVRPSLCRSFGCCLCCSLAVFLRQDA
jgi:hypothetical protein